MGRVAVLGYLSIDTIATPAGIHRDVPGGAALYAALGARAAGADVRLHACAGEDFAPHWLAALARCGVDVDGVEHRAGPTRRARLAHGDDGRRASPHHAEALWWERTTALAPTIPAAIEADIVALAPMPMACLAPALEAARRSAARAVADTSEAFARREGDALLTRLGELAVFAPSREETRVLLPDLDDDEAAATLAARGCAVLQKRGAEGALAIAGGTRTRLPAPATTPVDPTGAGDATVGALAGYMAAGIAFVDAARRALEVGARTVTQPGPGALGLAWRDARGDA